jgi:UDP-glucose 4-epimerase
MLKNKDILVTGGAGFIGSHLTERLLDEGCRVTVLDDLSEGKWTNLQKHPNLTKFEGSILGDVSKVVCGKDVVFHLAAIPWPQMSVAEPLLTHNVNVNGTLNLLLAARRHRVNKFIFSSSYTVYPKPLVPYSLQKLIGENYCQLFSELWGLETVCLRYFNVFGPRMRSDGPYANLIPRFIKLMSHGKGPTINGDGRQTRDFVYVSDVVEANILAAESSYSGKIFNIGSGKSLSVNKVVEILNHLLGKNIRPLHRPAVVEQKVASPSPNFTDRLPGWKPKISLETGLRQLISFQNSVKVSRDEK